MAARAVETYSTSGFQETVWATDIAHGFLLPYLTKLLLAPDWIRV